MILLRALDKYRNHEGEQILFGDERGNDKRGAFWIPSGDGFLKVIADTGKGWDHVSVSCSDRCPTWEEMSHVHRLFFKPHEIALEYHIPLNDHINIHPFVLHLWRPTSSYIPVPPKWRV